MTNSRFLLIQVMDILRKLRDEWPGNSYDLLSRNCCHFCEAFCRELKLGPVPGNPHYVQAAAQRVPMVA